jgi:hypothetical protein
MTAIVPYTQLNVACLNMLASTSQQCCPATEQVLDYGYSCQGHFLSAVNAVHSIAVHLNNYNVHYGTYIQPLQIHHQDK